MRCLAAGAVLAATFTGAVADLCADGSVDDNGNWYCQEVDAVTYTGLSGTGSYNKVTSMDSTTSVCDSTPFGYSGSMSPLDEEVSLHFRGPLALKQFAVYIPGSSSSSSSKKAKRSGMKRHGHDHVEKHKRHGHDQAQEAENEKRAPADMVVATIDGQVVSWTNNWSGEAAATSAAATSSAADDIVIATIDGVVVSWTNNWSGETSAAAVATTTTAAAATTLATSTAATTSNVAESSSAYEAVNRIVPSASSSSSIAVVSSTSSSSTSSSSSATATQTSSSGSWTRQAYYNAESGTADGVVFLNHMGGSGSGVFDYTFGNSLSYSSDDGTAGASSPQVLADTTLGSDIEVVIMSDSECSDDDDDCGYVRDGTVAYHGWSGAQKAFLFEFQMPLDGNTDSATNGDMPAIWMLNAQIPRTLQYGQADCSCWESGCGEFDIFEVLAPGDLRCKSTLHGNINGGDSDYFARPTGSTIKAALIMNGDNIHIKLLDDDYEFGSSLDESSISDICSTTLIQSLLVSIFNLVS